jgi:effector-binding domain-containing protein
MTKKNIAITGSILAILLYLLVCMFSPAMYSYKDEIKITGPYKMVFVIINDIKDWPKWYSWQKSDPELVFSKGGRELNKGANFSFESSDLGKGYVELLEGYQDSTVSAVIKGSKIPNDLEVNWQILPEGTKSVYVNFKARLTGKIPFIQRAYYLGMHKKLDKLFHDDLEGIKTYVEDLVKGDFGVEKVTYEGQKYFGKLDIIVNSKIPQFYAKYLPLVYKMLDSMKVEITGPPAGLIFDWEAKSGYVAIMAALPINVKLPNIPGWSYIDVQKAECFKYKNFGSYTTLRNAHAKLTYLMDNSPYTLGQPVIEEYVTSPSQEPDTSKWQTNIYYLFYTKGGYSKTVEQKRTLEEMIKMEDASRLKKLKDLYSGYKEE